MKGLLRSLHNHRLHLRRSSVRTSDHYGSNFSYNSQVLRRKHPVLGIKLNPLSLLFQMARYPRNNILINGFNNGFRTFRRNHMFSVAMCIMSTRALWLGRVCCSYWLRTTRVFFLYFLWLQRSYLTVNFGNFFFKNRLIFNSCNTYVLSFFC